jgi:hypothetical protein
LAGDGDPGQALAPTNSLREQHLGLVPPLKPEGMLLENAERNQEALQFYQ